jgi:excisionase family DNA binding protein
MNTDFQTALAEGRGVTVEALAHALGVSLIGIQRAVKRGEIPVTRVGRRVIVTAPVARRLLGLGTEA